MSDHAAPLVDITPFGEVIRPAELLRTAIDQHRHEWIGGGTPGDVAGYLARWLTDHGYELHPRAALAELGRLRAEAAELRDELDAHRGRVAELEQDAAEHRCSGQLARGA